MTLLRKPRTIIITGGARGIGSAITKAFYDAGDKVIIASRKDTGLSEKLGDRARFIHADLRKPNSAKDVVHIALEWTGSIDVLINNVGISAWKSLAEIDECFLQDMFDTNLKTMFFMCQAVAPHLKVGGSIVNVSSLAGKRGSANNSVYCATKFGVNGLTQSLAKELGPTGVRVNAVCPVYIPTDGLIQALQGEASPLSGVSIEEYLNIFSKSQTALGILPTARQVAETCVFLSSPAAAAITGQCLNVDCGVMPQ